MARIKVARIQLAPLAVSLLPGACPPCGVLVPCILSRLIPAYQTLRSPLRIGLCGNLPGMSNDGSQRTLGTCRTCGVSEILFDGSPDSITMFSTCEELSKLLAAYRRAVAHYNTAVEAMEAASETVSREEYHRMRGYVEQSRMISEQARIKLDQHLSEHGCVETSIAGA
jgi:hypothetical protein